MRLGDSVFRPNLNITLNGLNSSTFFLNYKSGSKNELCFFSQLTEVK